MFDIRRFDIYRKLPKDLTQPTTTGAVISIFSSIFIVFLLISEGLSFLRIELVNELYVDDPTVGTTIPVKIKLAIPNMGCEFLGIDIQDNQGRHEVGYMENTVKLPINENKGCLFSGEFYVNKVPGNFHIATHSSKNKPAGYNFNHEIHDLYFGEDINDLDLKVPGNRTSLAGKKTDNSDHQLSYDYTLKIVPTVYTDITKKTKFGYQYTATSKAFRNTRGMPAIWVRYEITPITVKYTEKKKPLYHFLTTICAIIGGTFTVAGMIDSMIFSTHQMVKKASEGKLG